MKKQKKSLRCSRQSITLTITRTLKKVYYHLRTYLKIIRICAADNFEIGFKRGRDSLIERGLFSDGGLDNREYGRDENGFDKFIENRIAYRNEPGTAGCAA